MKNYLPIAEAIKLSGIAEDEFYAKYVNGGIISVQINNGNTSIELSEFLRVFPNARYEKYPINPNPELELQLKQLKLEHLEYQIANLEQQVSKQQEEYEWLRTKFDNTTLLLEQKLDTSEVDRYKQEIRQLSHLALEWEKKYNTLLAANELKSLMRENRDLKDQLSSIAEFSKQQSALANAKKELNDELAVEMERLQLLKTEINKLESEKNTVQETFHTQEVTTPVKPVIIETSKRRKLFGIF